jgi:hypothetical protein
MYYETYHSFCKHSSLFCHIQSQNNKQYPSVKLYRLYDTDTQHNDNGYNNEKCDTQNNEIKILCCVSLWPLFWLSWHCYFLLVTITGATTLSITTFSIMALSIKGLVATFSINDTKQNHTLPLWWINSLCWVSRFLLLCWMSLYYAECRGPQSHLIN